MAHCNVNQDARCSCANSVDKEVILDSKFLNNKPVLLVRSSKRSKFKLPPRLGHRVVKSKYLLPSFKSIYCDRVYCWTIMFRL